MITADDKVFATLWAHYAPMLDKAIQRCGDGAWQIEDVKERVMSGQMQFWHTDNAAVVTEILHYPRKKALNCWLCGGDMREMEELYPSLEQFARQQGCYAMYGAGRRGWVRKMKQFGWREDTHVKKILE